MRFLCVSVVFRFRVCLCFRLNYVSLSRCIMAAERGEKLLAADGTKLNKLSPNICRKIPRRTRCSAVESVVTAQNNKITEIIGKCPTSRISVIFLSFYYYFVSCDCIDFSLREKNRLVKGICAKLATEANRFCARPRKLAQP